MKNQINAIFSQNDEMVMGALKAAENNNMKENMIIVGVDAIPDALQAVKDGRLDATGYCRMLTARRRWRWKWPTRW